MWLPRDIIAKVDEVAQFHYVDLAATRRWNQHKDEGELRLLTGWAWVSRDGRQHRQGFKTLTICYRDAYYSLIRRTEAPTSARPRLRVVARRVA